MKSRIILFSILTFTVLGFTSCQKDEIGIKFYYAENTNSAEKEVSQITAPLGDFTVTIKGGSGIYSVVSDNPEVLTAEIESNTLKIAVYQIGVANLTISDSDLSSVLHLTIKESIAILHIRYIDSFVEIEGGNADVEKSIRDEIKATIEGEDRYELYFQKKNEGNLFLFKKNSEQKKGYFKTEYANEFIYLNIKYEDGKNDILRGKEGAWEQDFLDEYKLKYPELKLIKVVGYKMAQGIIG